jgi:hypothetical protein
VGQSKQPCRVHKDKLDELVAEAVRQSSIFAFFATQVMHTLGFVIDVHARSQISRRLIHAITRHDLIRIHSTREGLQYGVYTQR